MTDEDLAKLGKLTDQKNQPIHDQLKELNNSVNNPEAGLQAVNQKLGSLEQKTGSLETGLKKVNQKLDAVIGELALVHKKVDSTYDLVKFHKDKNEAEFDEIREHTKMPPAQREPQIFK